MISSKVYYVERLLLNAFEDKAEELGMLGGPKASSVELPAVNDVTVEHQSFAACVPQKMHHFLNLGILRTQV